MTPAAARSLACLPLVLAGCSASGLDARTGFGCKAPDGVTCLPVSAVYAASRERSLPAQQSVRPVPAAPSAELPAPPSAPAAALPEASGPPRVAARAPLSSGTPVRTAPRVLRIWLAPYEDSDGDLRDQAHLYVTVDRGAWQLEHTRQSIQERFAPLRALPSAPVPPANPVPRLPVPDVAPGGLLPPVGPARPEGP
jgi:conjugal transfer pilus assembly protein TraV